MVGASPQFAYYVSQGWYFVAFKVTTDNQDPPPGSLLCGDLGPIELAFPSASLVVPARIASASSSAPDGGFFGQVGWRVFTLAPHEMSLAAFAVERFSGALSASDLSSHPAVAQLATAGDRLTEFEVDFSPSQLVSDLTFQTATADSDFRRTTYHNNFV